jgi:tRNA-2-methylthio-N6-dimethylallyladenosine synthase
MMPANTHINSNKNYKYSFTSIIHNFYIESFGCQMNIYDSEIIISILSKLGLIISHDINETNLILFNTCSIREKSEQTVFNRLNSYNILKKTNKNIIIGILGCMSERFKFILVQGNYVDFIVGPNAYRYLPNLINLATLGYLSINVNLSHNEIYSNINPYKTKITTSLTISRGCDNMCTFCIVPFTRGREHSRDTDSIVYECQKLWNKGYKEVTLLGQNVDSYISYSGSNFFTYRSKDVVKFYNLLEILAKKVPNMRIRFTTSNPYDIDKNVLKIIYKYPNICKHIHLPVQSGSNIILRRMNRKYYREEYLSIINDIRTIIPNCSISHDIIVGFCGETEEDHKDTITLMNFICYDFGYTFYYSERKGTKAEKYLLDDVPKEIKIRRLQEIIHLQRKHSYKRLQSYIGKNQEVLIEGESKKSSEYFYGRNSQNYVIVFPKSKYKIGDLINVRINRCTSATLLGEIIY